MSMLSQKHSGCQEIQLAYRLTAFSPLETGYLTKEGYILHTSFVSVQHLADSIQILPMYVLYDRPRMVWTLLIIHHLSSWITWGGFSPCSSVTSGWTTWTIKILKSKHGYFWNMKTIYRFVFYLWHLQERLLKAFCLRRWFLTVKTKLWKFSVP